MEESGEVRDITIWGRGIDLEEKKKKKKKPEQENRWKIKESYGGGKIVSGAKKEGRCKPKRKDKLILTQPPAKLSVAGERRVRR